jgi:hypothetical protein
MMLSSSDTNELAPAVHTGSLECPCVPNVQRNNRLRAFWPEPISIFGSLGLTMLMAVHLCWAFHSACPSDRIDARSLGNHLTAFSASQGCQDVVSAASDKTVTSFAGADRLLRTESQVWFTHFISCQTITVTPSFRTHALPLILTRFLRLAKISPNVARNASLVLTALLHQLLTLLFHRVANRVANFVASDVASRDYHPVANHVASPLLTVLLTMLPPCCQPKKLASMVARLACRGGVRTFAAACGWRTSLACFVGTLAAVPGCNGDAGASPDCFPSCVSSLAVLISGCH